MAVMETSKILIEVWSDVVCPFCYIGKRNLESALESFQNRNQVKIVWKSFELDPKAPKVPSPGINDIYDYLAKKYGRTRSQAIEMNQHVSKMAKNAGLEFRLDLILPTNSLDAHRLIHFAKSKGLQEQAKEKLLSAYFTEGKKIAEIEALLDAAKTIGLDPNETKIALENRNDDELTQAVRVDETQARELGIHGVPFFVFNKRLAVSGAQGVDIFLQALNQSI